MKFLAQLTLVALVALFTIGILVLAISDALN